MIVKNAMKKLLLVINPEAGKSALRSQLIDVVDLFTKNGYIVTSVVSQSSDHVGEILREYANNSDLIVCCGGDGTLNLTVSAMSELSAPPYLGYIPCGTTNDFAKSRGISSTPLTAAKQIVEGSVHEIDLGFLGEKPYAYIAAFGMLSEVSYETPRQLKKNIGHAAYVLEGIKSLSKTNCYNIKFTIDGEVHEGEYMLGLLTNTRRIGGFNIPIIKDFVLDDGLIDITLVKYPKNAEESTKLLNSFVTQQPDNEIVFQYRASKLEYVSDSKIPWTLDGEYGGSYNKQTVEIKQRCLKLLY